MSLTMHMWDEEICSGHYCCKDCDICHPWADLVMEKEEEEETPLFDPFTGRCEE